MFSSCMRKRSVKNHPRLAAFTDKSLDNKKFRSGKKEARGPPTDNGHRCTKTIAQTPRVRRKEELQSTYRSIENARSTNSSRKKNILDSVLAIYPSELENGAAGVILREIACTETPKITFIKLNQPQNTPSAGPQRERCLNSGVGILQRALPRSLEVASLQLVSQFFVKLEH
mmetsp:Transcript_15147/g.40773  ORF Transcript_15147/g.40773 Transcript_15147/m.40773 type:complete len:172 (-) Transcript_15147:1299-1814(-)